jgi:hypothetical protein
MSILIVDPIKLARETIEWHEANWPGHSSPSLEIALALVAATHKPIPEGVYYISDTFRTFNGVDMGSAFYIEWHGRKEEFPKGIIKLEPFPSSVFYHEESDQFLTLDGAMMVDGFYARWAHRRHEFPKSYMKRNSKPYTTTTTKTGELTDAQIALCDRVEKMCIVLADEAHTLGLNLSIDVNARTES